MGTSDEPGRAPDDAASPTSVAGSSLAVAAWTVVSRVTGFGRIAAVAAVLGPTYLGNTFQATNLLPNLAYEFLTGTLFSLLLVPRLVRHADRCDTRSVERLAGGFLGVSLLAFALVAALVVFAGPLILRLFALGVNDPGTAAEQRRIGWLLMTMLMPQVVLYGVAGVAGAVLNAHGRFALPAGAPALENVGVMATMGATAVLFGTGTPLEDVSTGQLLLLGLGATTAVAVHAGLLWGGAWRVGVRLVPRLHLGDPEVRAVIRQAVPSLGYSAMNATRVFAILVVANRIPGGIVAFQLALNLSYLPVAIGARSVAVALLPRLSRLRLAAQEQSFRDELVDGLAMTFFLVVPASLAYVVLARPLARAVSFGEMATEAGLVLVTASLAALGLGVVGDSAFVMETHAAYARDDARSPVVAMVVRTLTSLAGMLIAYFLTEGTALLIVLGAAVSVGNVVGVAYLGARLRAQLPSTGTALTPSLLRAVGASALMLLPAYVLATRLADGLGDPVAVVAAGIVGATIYLLVQRAWHSPELVSLRRGVRTAPSGHDESAGGSGR